MKKNVLKFSAVAMALLMAMGTSVFATDPTPITSSGDAGTITVTPQLKDATYKVTVPTTFDFTIQKFDEDDKISSGDLIVKNESDVPIKFDVTAKVTALGSNVTLKKVNTEVKQDIGYAAKEAYLKLVPAKDLNGDNDAVENYSSEYATVYGTNVDTTMSLIVAKGTGSYVSDVWTPTAGSYAAFKIAGTANPYADWKNDSTNKDITLGVTYNISGIADSTYTTLTTAANKRVDTAVSTMLKPIAANSVTLDGKAATGNSVKVTLFADAEDNAKVSENSSQIGAIKIDSTLVDRTGTDPVAIGADGTITISAASILADARTNHRSSVPVMVTYYGTEYTGSISLSSDITGITSTTKEIKIPVGQFEASPAVFDLTKLTSLKTSAIIESNASKELVNDLTAYSVKTIDSSDYIVIPVTLEEDAMPTVDIIYNGFTKKGTSAKATQVTEAITATGAVVASATGVTVTTPSEFDTSKITNVHLGAADLGAYAAVAVGGKFTVDGDKITIPVTLVVGATSPKGYIMYDGIKYTFGGVTVGAANTLSVATATVNNSGDVTITMSDGSGEKAFASFSQLKVTLTSDLGGGSYSCLTNATTGATENIIVSGKTVTIKAAGFTGLVDDTKGFTVDYVASDGETYTVTGSFPS